MGIKNEILKRFSLIFWLTILVGVLSIIISFIYMFFMSDYFKQKSSAIKPIDNYALRGDILDVNGRVISTNSSTYEIRMDPKTEYLKAMDNDKKFSKIDSLSEGLSELFKDKTKQEYSQIITNAMQKGNRNVLIYKGANYFQYIKLRKLPLFRLSTYKGGLIYKREINRKKFSDSLARRIIGVNNPNGHSFGIEKLENEELAGTNGKEIAQTLAGGYHRTIKTITEPENGSDVVTTLDINLQEIIEKHVRKRLYQLQAESGVAILMEVATGEIRAMVNLSKRNDSTYGEIRNLAVASNYEPGSVMKLVSFMIAFDKDPDLKLTDVVNTGNGKWQIAKDFAITDYNYRRDGSGGFGKISVKKVFEVSSNVGTTKIIHELFKDNNEEFLDKIMEYGFGQSMNLGLEDEPAPIISGKRNKSLSGVSTRQISIGYEISITPMHIITFYNAVANNGIMVKPMFIKEIRENGRVKIQKQPKIINSLICSEATLKKCKILLEGVVNNGTGYKYVHSNLINIAGKSGTSQIYTNRTTHNTTFVGYFPAEKPKYTCLVWFSQPQNNKSGSMAAGPVLKSIAEDIYTFDYDLHNNNFVVNDLPNINTLPDASISFAGFLNDILNTLKIPHSTNKSEWVVPTKNNNMLQLKSMHIKRNVMPDVRGMNARDAIYILEKYKFNINIKGYGKVVSQSIAPDTKISLDDKNITLKLSM